MSSKLALKALDIAITQIGKEENPRGSNWGKPGDPVPMYLRAVNINFPASWCMAFVIWCIDQARAGSAVLLPIYRSGGVLSVWEHSNGFRVIGEEPQPGDIFIMDLGHGLGHTGFVERVDLEGVLLTIEGNTNDTGSREGYEVARKLRHNQKPIIGYLRF